VGSIVNGYAGYLPTDLDYLGHARASIKNSYEMDASPYNEKIEGEPKSDGGESCATN
jgi:hypothetical protein